MTRLCSKCKEPIIYDPWEIHERSLCIFCEEERIEEGEIRREIENLDRAVALMKLSKGYEKQRADIERVQKLTFPSLEVSLFFHIAPLDQTFSIVDLRIGDLTKSKILDLLEEVVLEQLKEIQREVELL